MKSEDSDAHAIRMERSLHILSMSSDGFVVLMDNKIFFTNKAFRKMLGVEGNELYNLEFEKLVVPGLSDEYIEKRNACLQKNEYDSGFPMQIQFDKGRTISVDIGFSTIFIGNETAVLIVIKDKTEQIELQEAALVSENRFQQLYNTSPISYFSLSQRGTILELNPAAEKLLGYDADDMVKRDVSSILATSGPSAGVGKQLISEVLQGKLIRDVEMQFKKSDGDNIWVSVTASLLESHGSPLIGLMAIDVDRRKTAETRERTERNRANLYLEVMTHDLTNVHQSLLFSVGLMDALLELPEAGQKLLDESHWNLRRAARMIANLRSLMTVGTTVAPTEPSDISMHLDNAIDQVRNDYPSHDIKFNITKPDEIVQVVGEDHLHKIFFTILHNSVMHNESEQVVIDIDIEPIDASTNYQITFSDNGLGVPDSLKEYIFKRTGAPDSQIVGRGLGLTLVDSMIETIGGKVHVEDRVKGDSSQGAKFIVEIPMWKAEIILECGRSSCITFYKSNHCLFCEPTLEILTGVLEEMGMSPSIIEIINVDDPSVDISEDEIPILPLTRICDTEISGFADVDQVRMAVMGLFMKSCFPHSG
ncbi:MAG: PAS domain S-box protein [Candidatus Thorarchaeota archaeon]